jgi:hypothetical protein
MVTRIVLLSGSNFAERVSSTGIQRIPIRESQGCDDFLKEVGVELKVPGAIYEGQYIPSEGEILICWPDALQALLADAPNPASVAMKSILVGVPRNRAVYETESAGLAAVIDSAAYSQWLINYPRAETALYGLRKIQDAFSAETSRNPNDMSPNYVRYIAPAAITLPRFVGSYIHALFG